jgi:hypothetical protein
MGTAVLVAAAMLTAGYVVVQGWPGDPARVQAAEPEGGDGSGLAVATTTSSTTTTSTTTTTSSTTTTTTSLPAPEPPSREARYVVPPIEAEPEAKQLAADIAYALTTYEADDDPMARLGALTGGSDVELLARAAEPLTHAWSWSRGQVIYPQLGGLRNGRVSVMVVTRQTVGSGSETAFSVVRTMDIRLVRGDSGWEFDHLASAGGTFESLEDLALAHAVARDPRIEMPDSARLDILSGLVSPVLLGVMADIADQTPYGVVVLATGHPFHVFETDRQSHHTVGRAVDIYRVGDRAVIDDRGPNSATRALVEWLYRHPDVLQVGSPWDIDGESRRSFTDAVHQDHIHLAVNDGR